jgi:hypothetical protein
VPYLTVSALCVLTLAALREVGAIQPVRPPA